MDASTTTLSQASGAIYEQHSVSRTLVVHLLAEVLMLVFFAAVAPLVVRGLGFPPAMSVYLAFAFVGIPFELSYLIYQARKMGTSLGNIVLYRQPVPRGQFIALVVALFVWALLGIYGRQSRAAGTFGLWAFVVAFLGTAIEAGNVWAEVFVWPTLAQVAPDIMSGQATEAPCIC